MLAALCLVAFGVATTAHAGDEDIVNSRVSLEVKRDVRFKGKVKSPASACAIGRKVLIYRAEPGRDEKVGKAFTSELGKYAVRIPMQGGNRIYSLVRRLRTPQDDLCEPDRSRTITV